MVRNMHFGRLETIQTKIKEGLTKTWQHTFYQAVSPTPAGSILLANAGCSTIVYHKTELLSALGRLSIDVLPLDNKRKQQLKKIGARVLHDLWRLPTEGIARRFGMDLVHYFDRALGKLFDPLVFYQPAPRFEAAFDFSAEVHDAQRIVPFAYELLIKLSDFLRGYHAGITRYQFYFSHAQHPPTRVNVGIRQATHDAKHLMMLFETHLNRLHLAVPVTGIKVIAEELHVYKEQSRGLFPGQGFDTPLGHVDNTIEELLDQLQARLGYKAVKGIATAEEHRPEYAHRDSELFTAQAVEVKNTRPFWLFPAPQPLLHKNRRLYYEGVITLLSGPERIETGWWTGRDMRRDYYVGVHQRGGRLWVYCDLAHKRKWYLHGLFG